MNRPTSNHKKVALKLAVSSAISDERILAAIGTDVSIWEIQRGELGTSVLRN